MGKKRLAGKVVKRALKIFIFRGILLPILRTAWDGGKHGVKSCLFSKNGFGKK